MCCSDQLNPPPISAVRTNYHALVVLVDTGRRPNDVDLAALTHSPTTFVHNLGSRLRYVKCAKVGIHLG